MPSSDNIDDSIDDSIDDIQRRSLNKVSALGVQQMDNYIQELMQQQRILGDGDILFSAAIGVLIDRARESRADQLSRFWDKVEEIFSPGDRIEWYSGWGMEQGIYQGHSQWRIDTKSDSGVSQGHPIIIDTEWEKIS